MRVGTAEHRGINVAAVREGPRPTGGDPRRPASGHRSSEYDPQSKDRLPDDEDVAVRTVDDLRADGSEQEALEWIQASASYDGEVGILRRFYDDIARITLGFDCRHFAPASRQQRLGLLQILPPSLYFGRVQMSALRDPGSRVGLSGRHDDDSALFASKGGGALQSTLRRVGSVVTHHDLHLVPPFDFSSFNDVREESTSRLLHARHEPHRRGVEPLRSAALQQPSLPPR